MIPQMGNSKRSRETFFAAMPDMFISNKQAFAKGLATDKTPPVSVCEHCGAELLSYGIMGLSSQGSDTAGILWRPDPERCDCAQAMLFWQRHDAANEDQRRQYQHQHDAAVRKAQLDKLLSQSGIVDRYAGRSLKPKIEMKNGVQVENKDGFQTDGTSASIVRAYAKARGFVEAFDKALVAGKGLYFSGPYGTGKTHLAAGIALELCKRMKPVIMLSMIDMLARIRDTFDDRTQESEARLMAVLTSVDLLVIDDLGKEAPSEWTLEKLYQVINARYERKRPVIITTNYTDQELINRLAKIDSSGRYRLDVKTAKAIVSRLHEMCSFTEMSGTDWRGRIA